MGVRKKILTPGEFGLAHLPCASPAPLVHGGAPPPPALPLCTPWDPPSDLPSPGRTSVVTPDRALVALARVCAAPRWNHSTLRASPRHVAAPFAAHLFPLAPF